MWLLFQNVKRGARCKDLLRLLISFEVPKMVGIDSERHELAADVHDWECISRILKQHMHYVHYHLGEQVTFHPVDNIPRTFRVRAVEGRAEA